MDVQYAASLIGKSVDFSLTGTGLGTQNFSGVRPLAVLDYSTALTISNIYQEHTLLFPSLPQGTPNNAEKYLYLKVQLDNGLVRAIGLPWIVDDSVNIRGGQSLTLVLNDASQADVDRLRAYLVSNNRTQFTIKLD